MRRSLLLCLCTLFLLLGTQSVTAQSNLKIYAEGGPILLNEPRQFDSFYSRGPQFGGGIGYVLTRQIEAVVRINYARFPYDQNGSTQYMLEQGFVGPDTELDIAGSNATLFSGTLNFKFQSYLRQRLFFYLIGGVGLYQQSFYGVTVTDSQNNQLTFKSQDKISPGLNFGFGLKIPITPQFEAFLEPQYVLILSGEVEDPIGSDDPTEDKNADPLARTGNVNYFPLRVGLGWSF